MSKQRAFRPLLERLEDRCVPAIITVKNLLDDGSPGTLRSAILAANALPNADTIVFRKGLEGTIVLDGTEIAITNNLTVKGPGANKIAISGDFTSRIFNIDNGAADLTVKLSGLELRHALELGFGGAIQSNENLTLTRMVFTLNQADLSGGAVACFADLKVTKSTIAGNTAVTGVGGGIFCSGTATISGSTISGNTTGNTGGGVYCGDTDISGSTISGNSASGYGGGIVGATVTISGSTISGNTAGGYGGGIASTDLTITGSTITNNTASDSGGGIFCATTLEITGSTISANTATNAGGGIDCPGAVEIINSTISGNAGSTGGGIECGQATINRCTIAANTAGSNGGGLRSHTAEITGSTFAGNRASNGGGLFVASGGADSQVRNCTFSGNRAVLDGGGIFCNAADLNVRNCTIAFNRALQSGGGVAAIGSSPSLESCLIADNTADNIGDDLVHQSVTEVFRLDHCLLSRFVDSDAELENFTGGSIDTGSPGNNLFNVEAKLAPLANNGGPTKTHKLKKGSPAINQGIVSVVPGLPNLKFDQRGVPFKRKLGPAVDIGAFERQ